MPDAEPVDVLFVGYFPQRGAIAEGLATLAAGVAAHHRVAVLAPEHLPAVDGAVAEYRFPYSSSRPYRALLGSGWRAHRDAAAARPRAVLLYSQHPLNVVAVRLLRRARVAFWWHEPLARGQATRARRAMYASNGWLVAPRADRIIVGAPSVAADVPSDLRARTSVVPIPAPAAFAGDSGRFADRPVDLVFFGKVERYKGLDVLAGALDVLAGRGIRPTLRIVGAGSLRDAAPRMAELVASSGDRVDVVDEYVAAADVGSALRSADVVVLPYLTAAGSSTIAVAGMHACCVVASRCGAFADYLDDGVSALLHEPGSPHDLADALEQVLADGVRRRALGDALHELYTERLDADVVARALAAVVLPPA